MPDEGIRVPIVATDQTQAGLDSAKAGIKNFGESASASLKGTQGAANELIGRFASMYGLMKLEQFGVNSVEQFAKVERAMNQLGAVVDSNGGHWAQHRQQVEDLIKADETLYGVTKIEMINALESAEIKTRDLGLAMKAVDDAAKLSSMHIGDFAGDSDLIAKAMAGNERAIMTLGRMVGVMGENGKDAQKVMEGVAKAIATAGSVAGDTQTQINTLAVGWETFTERMGETFQPLVAVVNGLEKILETDADELMLIAGIVEDVVIEPFLALWTAFQWGYDKVKVICDLLDGNFKQATIDAGTQAINLKNNLQNMLGTVSTDFKKFGQGFSATWLDGPTKKVDLLSDKAAALTARMNQLKAAGKGDEEGEGGTGEDPLKASREEHEKELAEYSQYTNKRDEIGKSADQILTDDWRRYQAAVALADKSSGDDYKKNLDAREASYKAYIADKERLDKEAAEKEKELDREVARTANKLLDEGLDLAADANKKDVALKKDAGVIKATISTAEAVAQALDNPYPLNIVLAALSAALGAVQIAKIEGESMAEGGIVSSPTHIVAGDNREPEAIVPLSKAGSMGFGGGGDVNYHGDIHNHFPSVTNAQDAPAAFAGHMQRTRSRAGYRQLGVA